MHDEHCGHEHGHHDHHNHVHSADGSCCGHDHSHGGRHVYIYSPSGAVRDKAAFKRGIKQLEALGHEVEVDSDALTSSQRLRVTTPPVWPLSIAQPPAGPMWR